VTTKANGYFAWPIMLLVFWMWVISPGKLAGQMFPVVEEVAMEATTDPEDPEWVFVSGSFIKHREVCRPLRIDWFLGTRTYPGPPIEYVWGKPEIRLEGNQVFEDWRVRAAPPALFDTKTFADVIHKCGVVVTMPEWLSSKDTPKGEVETIRVEFPWETRTAFWN
jgi:hypothetical protein